MLSGITIVSYTYEKNNNPLAMKTILVNLHSLSEQVVYL